MIESLGPKKRLGTLLFATTAVAVRFSLLVVVVAEAATVLGADESADNFEDFRFDSGDCDFYQLIDPGNRSYYLYSPGYPDHYYADRDRECRWFAKTSSPTDRLVLDCHEFDLPESSFCQSDALIVSKVGDMNFLDGVRHCGPRSFTAISRTNKMNIKFVAKRYSLGGKFMCSVGAKRLDFKIPDNVKNLQSCDCGYQNQGLFVNAKTAGVNEFPLMASLIDGQTANLFCGATVIGRYHALTSARCLSNVNPYQIALLVGDHDMTSDDNGSELVAISEIYIHPSYDSVTGAHDLAVVETHEEIPFSAKVGPACLPFKHIDKNFVGETVKVLGWGTVDFVGPVSGYLHSSELVVAPVSQCADRYKSNSETNSLCAYFSHNANTCQVDSGGPLLWTDPTTGRLNIIGVVSSKIVCTEFVTSVQTRLATVSHLKWIKVILTGQYYCT